VINIEIVPKQNYLGMIANAISCDDVHDYECDWVREFWSYYDPHQVQRENCGLPQGQRNLRVISPPSRI